VRLTRTELIAGRAFEARLRADAGARLWRDGRLIVDEWHAPDIDTSRVLIGDVRGLRLEIHGRGPTDARLELLPIRPPYESFIPCVLSAIGR